MAKIIKALEIKDGLPKYFPANVDNFENFIIIIMKGLLLKVLYFDPIFGTSGDMILASLIDAGVDKEYLKKKLKFITDFDLAVKDVTRKGVSAKCVNFLIHRKIKEKDFIPIIEKGNLPEHIKKDAIRIVKKIFEVERQIHKTEHLHLHELADADTLLDIVGVLVAIDSLNVKKIFTGPPKAGKGFIKTTEGLMPAFNFATARLLEGFPIDFLPVPFECTTPTGAAILSTIAEPEEIFYFKRVERIGLGAGQKDLKEYPNLLRVFIGKIDDTLVDECQIIETNIDDQNPQDYEVIFEKLYNAGALEVFLTPVIMKHSRPGILLTALAPKGNQKVIETIFQETTTIGLRIGTTKRIKLSRKVFKIPTIYGKIGVKTFEYNGKKSFSLEYRDLKKISLKRNIPLQDLRKELTQYIERRINLITHGGNTKE